MVRVKNPQDFWAGLLFLVVGLLAIQGILMASIPSMLVMEVFGVIGIYLILLDFVKVPIFSRLDL